jgi:hypothetical protein
MNRVIERIRPMAVPLLLAVLCLLVTAVPAMGAATVLAAQEPALDGRQAEATTYLFADRGDMTTYLGPPYFGKYRGTVINVNDPLGLCRVQVMVPDIAGLAPATWAMPALPFAGEGHGLVLLPEVGDGVWVEFEQGDPSYPIWTGSWVTSAVPYGPSTRALVTSSGLRVLLEEGADRIRIVHPGGAKIVMTEDGIVLRVGATSLALTRRGVYMNGRLVSKTSVR